MGIEQIIPINQNFQDLYNLDDNGIIITKVYTDTPADKAGLLKGEVIINMMAPIDVSNLQLFQGLAASTHLFEKQLLLQLQVLIIKKKKLEI